MALSVPTSLVGIARATRTLGSSATWRTGRHATETWTDFYLAVEALLRQALLSISAKNPDFPVKDLATMDAVVLEYAD